MRLLKVTYAQRIIEATASVEAGIDCEEFERCEPRKGNRPDDESHSQQP